MNGRRLKPTYTERSTSMDRYRSAGQILPLIAALILGLNGSASVVDAQADKNQPRAQEQKRVSKGKVDERAPWGEPTGGLRIRALAVTPKTDEQQPDFAKAALAGELSSAKDVTLLVELQNVGDKPLSLQGTRFGDSVTPPWPGKGASGTFAPYLFECHLVDKIGKPVEHPSREMLEGDAMMSLSGGLAETIEPGVALQTGGQADEPRLHAPRAERRRRRF